MLALTKQNFFLTVVKDISSFGRAGWRSSEPTKSQPWEQNVPFELTRGEAGGGGVL